MKHISISHQNIIGFFMQSRVVVATIIKNSRNPDFMSLLLDVCVCRIFTRSCRVSMNDTMLHFVQC